ncbi:MAG: hypothetical protein GY696_39650 [Gammaproteobacteria bacterium]|nr:hypothetical protein [Gammaproteobacteria bacterium]
MNAVPSFAQFDLCRMQDTLPPEVRRAWDLVQDELVEAKAKQRVQYDKTAMEHSFSACDLVMVCDDVSINGKLSLPFRGPWEIIEVTPTNVVISMRKGTSRTVVEKVHFDKLTKFHPAIGPHTSTRDRCTGIQVPSLSPPSGPTAVGSAGVAGGGGEGGVSFGG